MKLVLDANIVAYRLNDPERAPAIDAAIMGGELLAPEFLKVELHQVIWKHRALPTFTRDWMNALLDDFIQFPIRYVPDAELLAPAFNLACEWDITIYDALYAALAKREASPLLTADRKLAGKAKSAGIAVTIVG